ncbi:CrcB family protein [Actinomadura sp. ATCC 31491]|uniref:Fluoride-specific ion channel FluC n=1 Tax=Actinomadura luzonensis TaxID=2805427 RepID=A0ABT0FTY4_9ACTN|nr:CrcB family protein [Actinomadura luzonensis]MCK2215802.1 CrcB family protein [Actinomadura luzonensis]
MSSTPAYLRPRLIALVAAGGAAGTALRQLVGLGLPDGRQWPWALIAVNVTGAFALGLLTQALARRGPETRLRRDVRLGAGTGALGAYTTYSSLAAQLDLLARAGRPWLAAAFAVLSLAGGVAAGRGRAGARPPRAPAAPPAPGSTTGAGVTFWLVVVAGGLGAACRFVLDGAVRRRLPTRLPAATLAVNALGSLVLGAAMGAVAGAAVSSGAGSGAGAAGVPAPAWATVVGMGWCGGFTTFSTHMVETCHLAAHAGRRAAANLALMLAVTCAAASLGYWAAA